MKMRIACLLLALLALNAISCLWGPFRCPGQALFEGWNGASEYHYALTQYRLPRVVLAQIVGAALAVAGVLIQGLVRNPLASPDILGINHAASLASVAALYFIPSLSVLWLPLVAFSGGIAAMLALVCAGRLCPPDAPGAHRRGAVGLLGQPYRLPAAPAPEINNALLWLTGSLWARDGSFVAIALPVLAKRSCCPLKACCSAAAWTCWRSVMSGPGPRRQSPPASARRPAAGGRSRFGERRRLRPNRVYCFGGAASACAA